MRVFRIIIPVNDIESASKFYSTVFDLSGNRVSEGRHYFILGNTIVALYSPNDDGDDINEGWKLHENHIIYFAVENLSALQSKLLLLNWIKIDKEIINTPWGETLFYAIDPFDNHVCFVDEKTVFSG